MDETANSTETAETPEESETAEQTELEEDSAMYPEGYDPEAGEDFFPPEAPPLPELPTAPTAPDGQPAETSGQPAPESKPETPAPENTSGPAAFAADLEQISKLYPDAAESGLPKEVLQAYKSGAPLLNAYAAHRAKTDAETIKNLRAENAALKQAAANRERAVVRGVTGGSPVNEPDDPFLRGMREYW